MSRITSNEVNGLMEAYAAVHNPVLREEIEEEKKEIEEFSIDIIENAGNVLFSQGYDVYDLISYLADASEKTITEDYIAFSEGNVLLENVIASDDYVEEQFENLRNISEYLISEGLWDSAMRFVGRVASKPARMAAGARLAQSANPARTAKAYERLAQQKLTKAGFQGAGATFKNTADAARASAMAKPAGFLQKAASKVGGAFKAAKGALTKIPGLGAVSKVAGRALPVAGAALYGMDAADRFKKGDWGGGLLSTAGAVTSLVPGAGLVAGLAPAGIQMATDTLGLTGDKSLKKGAPPAGAPKPPKGAGMVNVPGKGQRYYSSSDQKYYKNYNDALAARQSRRGEKPAAPAAAPAAPSAPAGGGRAPSAPAAPAPAKPATPKPQPAATGTPMQQWAQKFPTLAAKVKPGQAGYEEISQTRDKPGPSERQDQTPTAGPTNAQIDTKSVSADIKAQQDKAMQDAKKKSELAASTTKESYDAYDVVLDYLISQGHAESLEEAHYIMLEMNSNEIQNILTEFAWMLPVLAGGAAAKAKQAAERGRQQGLRGGPVPKPSPSIQGAANVLAGRSKRLEDEIRRQSGGMDY